MQSYGRLAQRDSPHTDTQTLHSQNLSLLSPLSATANTAGHPISPAIPTKAFSNQKVQLHTLGLLRAQGAVRICICFLSCVQEPYCQQAAQSEGRRQQVGAGLSAPMAEHTSQVCLLTSAHVRGRGKRQRIPCCHSNKEKSHPPPSSPKFAGKVWRWFLVCVCL